MVITGDAEGLDTSVDQELGEDALELSLARLEIITANERLVLLCQLDHTRDEGVLRGTVDEGGPLEDGGDGEDGGGGDLGVRSLDRSEERVGGVVHSGDDIGVTLGVGGPEDDDLVQPVLLLEIADVLADVLDVG
jgi:hypothetical protein